MLSKLSFIRKFSTSFDAVILGCGSGGATISSKLTKLWPNKKIAILEPNELHYYQPLWTLVGAGIKPFNASKIPMSQIIPQNCTWIKSSVQSIDPSNNEVTFDGEKINYEYLIVCIGIDLDFDRIKGLSKAFETDYVCSNYSPLTVNSTWRCIQSFKGGNAIFTFPNTPIKCPGAPQKIMYLAEDFFRKNNVRDRSNIIFNSALEIIFGVKKYANSLNQIIKHKGIQVNFKHNLIEVKSDEKKAIFQNLNTNDLITFEYEMLHVTPPQKPYKILSPLADSTGFVDVNKETLQHKKYPNVFALGDCTNLPTSRTAAAVSMQSSVVFKNIQSARNKRKLDAIYNGYTSCPLVTSYNKCILAEFDYDANPLETFPFDQGKERRSMFFLKKTIIPFIYWYLMVKGLWNGPEKFRKIFRLGIFT